MAEEEEHVLRVEEEQVFGDELEHLYISESSPRKESKGVDRVVNHSVETIIKMLNRLLDKILKGRCKFPNYRMVKFSPETGLITYYPAERLLQQSTRLIVAEMIGLMKNLLTLNKSMTPRALYYNIKNGTSKAKSHVNPTNVESLLNDLCCELKCSRRSLGIASIPSKSCFGGCVKWTEVDMQNETHTTDCSKFSRPFNLSFDSIQSVFPSDRKPKFILILEKYTILQRLMEGKFTDVIPCVLVTGCGQPDLPCRYFVKKLHDELQIPVFAFVDFKPYGVDILKSFKVGSVKQSYDSFNLCVPSMKYVGLSAKDLLENKVPDARLLEVPDKSKTMFLSRAERLMNEEWVKEDPELLESLEHNIKWEKSADIEVLDMVEDFDSLHTFLLGKLTKALESMKSV